MGTSGVTSLLESASTMDTSSANAPKCQILAPLIIHQVGSQGFLQVIICLVLRFNISIFSDWNILLYLKIQNNTCAECSGEWSREYPHPLLKICYFILFQHQFDSFAVPFHPTSFKVWLRRCHIREWVLCGCCWSQCLVQRGVHGGFWFRHLKWKISYFWTMIIRVSLE